MDGVVSQSGVVKRKAGAWGWDREIRSIEVLHFLGRGRGSRFFCLWREWWGERVVQCRYGVRRALIRLVQELLDGGESKWCQVRLPRCRWK